MRSRAVWLLFPMLSACAGAAGRRHDLARDAPARAWHYTFVVDAHATQLSAQVCFDGPVPRALTAGGPDAIAHFQGASTVTVGSAVRSLRLRDRTLDLPDLPDGSCIAYESSLDVPRFPSPLGLRTPDGDVLISTNAWLFYPTTRVGHPVVTAVLTGPPELAISVPWPLAGSHPRQYWLDASTFRLEGYVGFGHFARETVATRGGTLDVAGIGGSLHAGASDPRPWLSGSADLVANFYGSFPTSNVQILLLEAPAGLNQPVPFAETSHAGGESVTIARTADADAATLARDGTAMHEFFHLGQPLLRDEDAWLAEGLATYYEEILRARAGRITPRDAWTALIAGFARGEADAAHGTLAEESAAMHHAGHVDRVYWAGAVVMLETDVALRREHASLDDAARALRACCRDRGRAWTADEVIARMDDATGHHGLVRAIASRRLASTEYPDARPTLDWLGVHRGSAGDIVLDDAAPGAAVRRAMTE